jgi:hypothetical protein
MIDSLLQLPAHAIKENADFLHISFYKLFEFDKNIICVADCAVNDSWFVVLPPSSGTCTDPP